jgi:hypothetical protein
LLPAPVEAGRFVAYSLKEAQRRLQAGDRGSKEIAKLGGLAHLAGMVYDRKQRDFILVGQLDPSVPALALDDFVVALRSLLVHHRTPEVSIDPAPTTPTTRRQAVVFKGGVEGTAVGNQMLEADLLLKNLALGRVRAEVWGVPSYFSMLLEEARNGALETRARSRFWFKNRRPSLAMDEDVCAILDQDVGVEAQILYAEIDGRRVENLAGIRDRIGDRFAAKVEENFSDLSSQFPALARVRPILAMVSLAEGVRRLGASAEVDYWLRGYSVPAVDTPQWQDLLEAQAEVEQIHKTLVVSGGIEINPIVVRLNAGDVTALREAVLGSRPTPGALTWNPPLEGWQIPGAGSPEPEPSSTSGDKPGFSMDRMLVDRGAVPGPSRAAPPTLPFQAPAAAAPRFDISKSLPPRTLSHNVGGVLLGGTARVPGAPEASVDLSRGNFSLIVEGQGARLAPETFRKFITALWAVYYSSQDPGISIDPIAPGVNKHLVRYIGRVINTDLGRVMRESDYAMKKWAVGTERPDVAGFEDVDRLTARHGLHYLGAQRRFWFVPEDMTFRRGGDALLFAGGRMTVKTEYVFQNKTAQAEPADERFAEFFTRHYQEIAKRYPFYQELFEYAKLVSLAKYLKESGVPLFWFLMANKDLVLTEDSPGTVDALARGSRYFEGLTIEGGVDLRTEGKYVYDEQALSAIQAARAKLAASAGSHDATAVVAKPSEASPERLSFTLGKESYSVLPQHSLTSGKDRRGIRYQTDFGLHGKSLPGLEMVRYYDSRRPDSGEFGKGWRLLIPYHVKPVGSQRREFLNVQIPERMAVENLVTGEQEVLTFSTDRYSVAGYVPDKLASSQAVGLFLMSDASFRLADKLGNEFWFDPSGDLTEMVFGKEQRMHIEYARGFTSAFAQTPYRLEPAGEERVDFAGARIPARMKVVDLASGASETLAFSDKGRIAGYAPADEKQSRFRILALLSDASFLLLDRAGNETSFDPSGKFENMAISPESRMVESISGGGYKVTFAYGTDRSGNVRIASGSLTEDKQGAEPARVAYYHYDEEGRLAQVTGREGVAPAGPPVGAP